MARGDVGDDGQAQPAAGAVAGIALAAVETLEGAFPFIGRDAGAAVVDAQHQRVLLCRNRQFHLAARRRVAQGIVEKVAQQDLQGVRIGNDDGCGRRFHAQFDLPRPGQRPCFGHGLARRFGQVQTLRRRPGFAGRRARCDQ